MSLKITLLPVTFLAVILTLAVACSEASAPAALPTSVGEPPAATPVPTQALQAARDFAQGHQQIDQEWDRFHAEFDQWRTGLASCDRSTALIALRGFTADFSDISRRTSNLPRAASTKSSGDRLIEVAEKEESALRQLRDRWHPNSADLFEAVDQARSAAAVAQKEVSDDLADLRESTSPEELDDAKEFSEAFDAVSEDWDKLRDSYKTLKGELADLSKTDVTDRLATLIKDLDGIKSAIDDLPSSDTSKSMISKLDKAADSEKQALSDLEEGYDEPEDAFDPIDVEVKASDKVIEQIQEDLEGILEDSSADKVEDIDAFEKEFDLLTADWDAFHDRYYDWLRTEGGCDRREVADALGKFLLEFGDLSSQVSDLPQASFLRPMNDALLEAAERESAALRGLRNTWRPFATDIYRGFDQERSNAGKLRRQADIGVQELLERFSISPGDL